MQDLLEGDFRKTRGDLNQSICKRGVYDMDTMVKEEQDGDEYISKEIQKEPTPTPTVGGPVGQTLGRKEDCHPLLAGEPNSRPAEQTPRGRIKGAKI